MPAIKDHPSPNFGLRRGGARADMVVLHYTGMASAEAARDRLCDPAAEVSAHYLIREDGLIWRLVAEEHRAWHAGVSAWGDVVDVNSHSIGIELANPGHDLDHELGYPPFPEPQMAALEGLLANILERHAIAPERVVSHACIAPGRKRDPGEKFDWRRLAQSGLAVWLDREDADTATSPDARDFAKCARKLGYAVPEPEHSLDFSAGIGDVWCSVAMRFMPAKAKCPQPDHHDLAHLSRLCDAWPVVKP